MAKAAVVVRPALVMLLSLVLLLAMFWAFQRRLIYFPDRSPVPAAASVLPGATDVTLQTSDGLRLDGWFAPPRGRERGMAVLVAGGNAGNRSARVPLAEGLTGAGFAVLLFDYRGYGGNPGRPSEAGLARDVRAALAYLVDMARVDRDRIVYFGESLGAAVVAELAIEYPPAALVLRSPFTSLADVGSEHYPLLPVRTLLRERYPVADQVERIDVPTAVVYGTGDTVVPPAQSRQVAQRAAGRVTVTAVPGAEHDDPELCSGPEVVAAVVAVAGR